MPIKRWHIEKDAIDGAYHIIKDTIPLAKLSSAEIQFGKTSVSFPFAVAGEENVSATVTFPKAFATAPLVVVAIEGADVGIVKVATTTTNFTVTVRDDKGTDYTAAQSATIHWIAIKP